MSAIWVPRNRAEIFVKQSFRSISVQALERETEMSCAAMDLISERGRIWRPYREIAHRLICQAGNGAVLMNDANIDFGIAARCGNQSAVRRQTNIAVNPGRSCVGHLFATWIVPGDHLPGRHLRPRPIDEDIVSGSKASIPSACIELNIVGHYGCCGIPNLFIRAKWLVHQLTAGDI